MVARLGPRDFGRSRIPFHGEVAQIRGEARPVLEAPPRTLVAQGLGLAAERGAVRLRIDLPEPTRALPDAAFTLTVQRFPMPVRPPQSAFASWAREQFATVVDRGWRLERDPGAPSRATLVYEPPPGDLRDDLGAVYFNLKLEALLAPSRRLRSRAFEAPPRSHLELAFGLASPSGVAGAAAARGRFAAALECRGAPERILFERRLDLSEPRDRGWHDVRAALPPDGSTCRLRLEASTASGEAPRGAVWAVPRLLAPTASGDRPKPNLLLISLDTLRADHVSGYGYARETTPAIDRELIARGTTFLDVSATFPQTDASHLSLFTSTYADARPVRGRLPATTPLPLLAERLRDAGFATAAFTEDALIAGSFGFWYGFDRFVERSFRAERGRETFADGERFLRQNAGRRFFLFLHTYKTHGPYASSDAYARLFRDPAEWRNGRLGQDIPAHNRKKVDAYDRAIREADDLVASVLSTLAELDLERHTLVVLLSDHGEAFGEHGLTGHGFSPHEEELRVPLVFRGPGVPAGLRIRTPVSLVDVAPTVLDLLGLPAWPEAEGQSLRAAFRGSEAPDDRPFFFSWLARDAIGVRRGRWKYVRFGSSGLLYDLESDPGEERPVRGRKPLRRVGERLLARHREEARARREALGPAPGAGPAIPAQTEESLRALGYID